MEADCSYILLNRGFEVEHFIGKIINDKANLQVVVWINESIPNGGNPNDP